MSAFKDIFGAWLSGEQDHATFFNSLMAQKERRDAEIAVLAADNPFGVEFTAGCLDDGGWRPSISTEARIGFKTREAAQAWCDQQTAKSQAALVYRVVER